MRAAEFITERKRKKRRRPKWAAYGPGPFGGYGFATGYSGDGGAGASGGGGSGSGVGENSNTDLDLDAAIKYVDDIEKEFERLSTQYAIIDQSTGRLLRRYNDLEDAKYWQQQFKNRQTKIVKIVWKNKSKYDVYEIEEGWKDAVAGAALGTTLALGGSLHKTSEPAKSNIDKPAIVYPAKKIQNLVTGSPHEALLKSEATKAGLSGTELAAFLAQCAHETLNFKRLVEFGNKLHFKKYEKKYSPKRAKLLGNIHPGDGIRFKGRGYIQLTGRYNYERAAKSLGIPLDQHPELLEQPEIAAKVAVWYWKHRVAPKVDDFQDVRAVTRTINPGMKGLQDRAEKFKKFVAALG